MGFQSNEIDRNLYSSQLQAGDHVYSFRNAHIYSHHGIYVGDNIVIQFTRTQKTESSNSSNRTTTRCNVCQYSPKEDRGVVKSCLECFLKGHRLFRFEYGVSSSHFVLKRSGTCTTGPCRYSPEEVVRRATEMLNSVEGFGEYNLLRNNCETFAVYCKTNKRISLQAYSLKHKAKTAFHDLTSQPFSVKNTAKTVFKLAVTHKHDTLRHDKEMHQQDQDDHIHPEEKDLDKSLEKIGCCYFCEE
ncbi:Endopeptidase, NLPC/P60 domain containing protein [Parasponia andersonii]|uniref:Endopeptidase, NLPC/P60 domain containing protein n=1 Tax=Parasponia andersonii TaxID=3476 RepID=A0A2P5CH67_PARAD|nr:Endopeptidase, NLPC/P60 domain containing protein [Parasponia andersonii]